MTLLYILITIFSFLIGHLDTQPTDNSAGLYMGISGKEYVVLSRLALPQKLDKPFRVLMATLVIKTRAAKTIWLGPLEKNRL